MLIVVSYDVRTESEGGKKRLRRVAKRCVSCGQRVQFSVFECQLDSTQFLQVKASLLKEIDLEQDSIRFYLLGNHYESRIEHFGIKTVKDLQKDTLIL